MASTGHTYGASCLLQPSSNTFTRRASAVSIGPPPMRPQYFYCSSLPIDDPLSPVPPPPSGSVKPTRLPPRPFAVHDNRALEEAWLAFHKHEDPKDRPKNKSSREVGTQNETIGSPQAKHDEFSSIFQGKQKKANNRETGSAEHEIGTGKALSTQSLAGAVSGAGNPTTNYAPCVTNDARIPSSSLVQDDGQIPEGDVESWQNDIQVLSDDFSRASKEVAMGDAHTQVPKKRSRSPFRQKFKKQSPEKGATETPTAEQGIPYRRLSKASEKKQGLPDLGSSPSERQTTGTPFLRVPSRMKNSRSRSRSPDRQFGAAASDGTSVAEREARTTPRSRPLFGHRFHSKQRDMQEVKVPVGVSRLHVVEIPNLKARHLLTWPRGKADCVIDGPHLLGSCA